MQSQKLYVAVSLDVDPDANRAINGRCDAVSSPDGGRINVKACRRGLAEASQLLTELGIPFTVFWEGRTLRILDRTDSELVTALSECSMAEHAAHGVRHEDLTGKISGVALAPEQIRSIMAEAREIVQSRTGSNVYGFRAPYCRLRCSDLRVLADAGYVYDASLSVQVPRDGRPTPYRTETLWEVPLCRFQHDRGGLISGYLWQLLEGKRRPSDYVQMARALAGAYSPGILQICLHPWHLVVNADGRPAAQMELLIENVRAVLERIDQIDVTEYLTVGQCYDRRSEFRVSG